MNYLIGSNNSAEFTYYYELVRCQLRFAVGAMVGALFLISSFVSISVDFLYKTILRL